MSKIYLEDIPLVEAQTRFKDAIHEAGLWKILEIENLPLDENILGRVWRKLFGPRSAHRITMLLLWTGLL